MKGILGSLFLLFKRNGPFLSSQGHALHNTNAALSSYLFLWSFCLGEKSLAGCGLFSSIRHFCGTLAWHRCMSQAWPACTGFCACFASSRSFKLFTMMFKTRETGFFSGICSAPWNWPCRRAPEPFYLSSCVVSFLPWFTISQTFPWINNPPHSCPPVAIPAFLNFLHLVRPVRTIMTF